MKPDPTISQLVKPEFDQIRRGLKAAGAKGDNPLTIERNPPEPGAVSVLLHNDLRSPYVRVSLADKPNLLPWPDQEPRDYPEPRFFYPVRDSDSLLGWCERNSMTTSLSTDALIAMILELAERIKT